MTSLKQIEANRRNALKSTGPITPEGKERSRRNAIRHGLTAETVITSFEDAEDYRAFEETVTAGYDAETAVERELVLRLASVLWRLRRATGIETALFDSATLRSPSPRPDQVPKSETILKIASLSEQSRPVLVEARKQCRARSQELANQTSGLAAAFMRLIDLPTFPLDRLSRYEHLLWRQARQLVFTLESLRRHTHHSKRPRSPFPFWRRDPSAQ